MNKCKSCVDPYKLNSGSPDDGSGMTELFCGDCRASYYMSKEGGLYRDYSGRALINHPELKTVDVYYGCKHEKTVIKDIVRESHGRDNSYSVEVCANPDCGQEINKQ